MAGTVVEHRCRSWAQNGTHAPSAGHAGICLPGICPPLRGEHRPPGDAPAGPGEHCGWRRAASHPCTRMSEACIHTCDSSLAAASDGGRSRPGAGNDARAGSMSHGAAETWDHEAQLRSGRLLESFAVHALVTHASQRWSTLESTVCATRHPQCGDVGRAEDLCPAIYRHALCGRAHDAAYLGQTAARHARREGRQLEEDIMCPRRKPSCRRGASHASCAEIKACRLV